MTPATPIPQAPPYFEGMINLRGQIIAVLDLRKKLNLGAVKNGPKTAIIILDLGQDANLGVIVDRINSVQAFHSKDIGEAPTSFGSQAQSYVLGVARKEEYLTLLLDMKAAIGPQDLKKIQTNNTASQSKSAS